MQTAGIQMAIRTLGSLKTCKSQFHACRGESACLNVRTDEGQTSYVLIQRPGYLSCTRFSGEQAIFMNQHDLSSFILKGRGTPELPHRGKIYRLRVIDRR